MATQDDRHRQRWGVAGTFESVMAAARRMHELEGNQAHRLFFEMFVEWDFGRKEEQFSVLQNARPGKPRLSLRHPEAARPRVL